MGYKYTNEVVKTKEYGLISLPDIKPHLNVDIDYLDDDQLLLNQVRQAISLSEDYANLDIALTHCSKSYYEFYGETIWIKEYPLIEITSIVATDYNDNNSTLVEDTDYYLITTRTDFYIKFFESVDYKKLVVNFDTGYTINTLPPSIQAAILIKVNDLYDMERTSYTVGVNFKDNEAFKRCLNGHVIQRW